MWESIRYDGVKSGLNYLLGRDAFKTASSNMLDLYDALQDSGKRNKFKYHTKDTMILGDIWKVQDSMNYWNDYMNNRNLDWADVKYPTMMSGNGLSSGAWSTDIKALMKLYE